MYIILNLKVDCVWTIMPYCITVNYKTLGWYPEPERIIISILIKSLLIRKYIWFLKNNLPWLKPFIFAHKEIQVCLHIHEKYILHCRPKPSQKCPRLIPTITGNQRGCCRGFPPFLSLILPGLLTVGFWAVRSSEAPGGGNEILS